MSIPSQKAVHPRPVTGCFPNTLPASPCRTVAVPVTFGLRRATIGEWDGYAQSEQLQPLRERLGLRPRGHGGIA